jgi:D-alanyl-D-alanine carboxypeptidase
MRCDERVISPLLEMMKAARKDGVSLIICSPYRDMDRQTMLFNNKVDKYMDAGMSYMEAYNYASQAVTVPGSSEHQIGLAIDIITDNYSSLDEGFANTAAGKWLAENSYKFGFVLRYPEGKEEITSIEFEPWHFRYVGVDAATVMTTNNICLEEFWSNFVE